MKYFVVIACFILLISNCFDPTSRKEIPKNKIENNLVKQGQEIAAMTFATLSSNLQKAMKEGGVSHAVKYCNIAASTLVDSIEQIHNVKIKRTSLKIRNIDNQPTEQERQQLLTYQQESIANKELYPVLNEFSNQTIYYAPIHVMPLCQKCHGTVGEHIMEKDYELIQSLYPSDDATNYKTGDLRGMWSITFYEPTPAK